MDEERKEYAAQRPRCTGVFSCAALMGVTSVPQQ